jgi:hypothetical protein
VTRRIAALVLAVACAVVLSACTSSKNGNGTASTPATLPSVATLTSAPTETVPTEPSSTATHTSSAPRTTHVTTTPALSTHPPAQPLCTTATLRVDVLRGGAIPGREIAVITFTNTSSRTCVLAGYPSLTLFLHGKQVGSPARHSTQTPTPVTLKPGAHAESEITDITACQAPISDTARITPPGSQAYVDRPLEMRACSLFVNPVTKASS